MSNECIYYLTLSGQRRYKPWSAVNWPSDTQADRQVQAVIGFLPKHGKNHKCCKPPFELNKIEISVVDYSQSSSFSVQRCYLSEAHSFCASAAEFYSNLWWYLNLNKCLGVFQKKMTFTVTTRYFLVLCGCFINVFFLDKNITNIFFSSFCL